MQASPREYKRVKRKISGTENSIKNIYTTVKENTKYKIQKAPKPNHSGNLGHNEIKPADHRNRREKIFQLKGLVNIFNKI